MKPLLPALVVLVSLQATPATAQDFDKGNEAYDSNDYTAALREFLPLAKQGHTEAQVLLGVMYFEGLGVHQNSAKAKLLFRKAAKSYREGAQRGEAEAQNGLGTLYKIGWGVPQDFAEAVKWFRLAVEQGNATAQSNLGDMYNKGNGVPRDYVQAHMWFNLAAAQGRKSAFESLDVVAQRMTPEQIAEAQRMAREWLEAHPQ